MTKLFLGAQPSEGGVAFRVWAPHASSVYVAGDFNQWSRTALPLERESDKAHWSGVDSAASVGDQYRYIIDGPDGIVSRIDPRARSVTNSAGNGIITSPSRARVGYFTPPARNRMVIYEMHVGTFNAPEADKVGTFADAAECLPHLQTLGVNAIQLMPTMEFAGDVSWGYNPAHIFAVETAYGGPQGLRDFVDAAHAAGIAVILDVVYNHFGPSDLDLWRFDGWSENGKGGIYFYNDWRSSTPWGETRPDFGREEVRSFIRDNAIYWFEEFGIDGLRFDMTLYIRNATSDAGDSGKALADGWSLLRWINDEIADLYPGRITIAEDLQEEDSITAPTGEGGAGFGAQWDAAFVHPVREALIHASDEDRSMASLAAAVTKTYNGDPFQRVIYTESHDEVANGQARVPHEIDNGGQEAWHAQKRSTLGAVLIFTSPGIPMLFQGQEFLQGDWFDDTVPIDWIAKSDFVGIANLYRDLISLRLEESEATKGLTGRHVEILVADETRKILVYRRFQDEADDGVIVALNFRHKPAEGIDLDIDCDDPWDLRLNTDWQGYSKAFGDFQTTLDQSEGNALLSIGPYTAVIFTR